MDWYYDVFGPDRFFVELQQHNIKEMHRPEPANCSSWARATQRDYVATNDVHYINQEDARLQDILLAIQTGYTAHRPRPHAHDGRLVLPALARGDEHASSPKSPRRSATRC